MSAIQTVKFRKSSCTQLFSLVRNCSFADLQTNLRNCPALVTIYCNIFNNISSLPCQFLHDNILFKKLAEEKLIEQIIEFELREPLPRSRIYTYTTGYFHDMTKQKSLRNFVEWIILLYTAKIL